MKKILIVVLICLVGGLFGGYGLPLSGTNDDYSINIKIDDNLICKIVGEDINKMTEDEFNNLVVLYLCLLGINQFVSYDFNDVSIDIDSKVDIDFFGRRTKINDSNFYETICKKLLPKWILERKNDNT